jgi:predicted TIM-barrel enzyme
MSGVSLSGELRAIHEALGVSVAQAAEMMREAAAASFMPPAARAAAAERIEAWRAA